MAPITYLWGPLVAYNLVAILAPVTAAWSAYWLCRHITNAPWASILGGATYGFGIYETRQLFGDLQMFLIFCPPLAVLCVLRFLDGRSSRRAMVTVLSVILLAQMSISPKVLFTMSVLGAAAMLLAWVLGTSDVRRRIVAAVPLVGVAYVITALLSSWYVLQLLKAPAYETNVGLLHYPTDVLAFFIPSPLSWIGGQVFHTLTARLAAGDSVETTIYLGVPLIAIIAMFVCTRWHERRTRFLFAMLILTVLWILGNRLFVLGKPTIWLPFSLVDQIPGFDDAMPGRVGLYVALLCAVILALWLARSQQRRVLRWSWGLLAVAFVLPDIVHAAPVNSSEWTNPVFVQTDMYRRYIRPGQIILPITWGVSSESTIWQAEDDMYYDIAGGDFFMVPPAGWTKPIEVDLWNDTPRPADALGLRSMIVERHVSDVIVQRSEADRWGAVLRGAGLHVTATAGGVTVYRVPWSWLRSKERSRS